MLLLSIFSHGVEPALLQLYRECGYSVLHAGSLRQALGLIKKHRPQVVVAEFVYSPTYGSQLSNFESLFAAIQSHCAAVKFIALVHKEDLSHLVKVSGRFPLHAKFTIPVELQSLKACLSALHRA